MSFLIQPPIPDRLNRCQLFGPGSRPELFEKMASSQADVINLDLEDSVAPPSKVDARKNISKAISDIDWADKTLSVRINGLDTEYWVDDILSLVDNSIERLDCIMIPLVKDQNSDLCSSKNYRSIALSSVFLKLLDWIILELYSDKLRCNQFQFGFQPKSNTMLCSWVLSELTAKYAEKGSDVFITFMDCTKAFDCVDHSILFCKIVSRGIPASFARMLLFSYTHQSAKVMWEKVLSREFRVTNGVRQRAVISPVLFNIYMDGLYEECNKKGVGPRASPSF